VIGDRLMNREHNHDQPCPDYIPKTGYFVELDSKDPSANRVWYDGKLLKGVYRVSITVDAENPVPWVEITLLTPLQARIATDKGVVKEIARKTFDASITESVEPPTLRPK
jgi:hypothetical protein